MNRALDKVQVHEGSLDASGLRFAVVVSRFNAVITERLLDGAVDALVRSGAAPEAVEVLRVHGAWEIPGAASRALDTGRFDAVVALGCLVKGDTIHFDLIAGEVTSALGSMGRERGVPVAFGVLTTNTVEEAVDRAGAKLGNKGAEAALAAVEQCRLYAQLGAREES